MKNATTWKIRFLPVLAVALLLLVGVGCTAPAVEEAATEIAAVEIEEIPVTTASDTARQLFDEGQYFLDVGRGVQAREKFRAAIAEDPGFVRAHFNQSNSALSFKEFQECLDLASEHLEGASDGEKLMVEINRTFLTNDTDQGVALAKELTDKYPNSPRAWIILAGSQGNQNNNQAARRGPLPTSTAEMSPPHWMSWKSWPTA